MGLDDELTDPQCAALSLASHFAYGAAMGEIYRFATGRALPRGALSGMLFGMGVWSGSYLGLLPAFNILPPATRHPERLDDSGAPRVGRVARSTYSPFGKVPVMRQLLSRTAALATLAGGFYLARRALRPKSHYSFCNRTVLITGGARGLGLELARRLVDQGARVAICARTTDDIDRAVAELHERGGAVLGIACDMAEQEQVRSFVQTVHRMWGPIDVLINNAGIIQVGPLAAMTVEDFEQAMRVHFWGPLHAVHSVLPLMRDDQQGRIVNISSIGGKISVPHLLPYCASKFALVGFSQGLRSELQRKGIYVTTVCPGLMRTGSPRNALFKGEHRAEYAWFSIGGSLPGLTISSSSAAEQILEACRRGDAELVPGTAARAAVLLHGLIPGVSAALLSLTKQLLPKAQDSSTETYRGFESFSEWSPSVLTELTERAAAANNELGEGPVASVHDPDRATR